MPLAHYTHRIMIDYLKLGWSTYPIDQRCTGISKQDAANHARSRLRNAARRLGVKITTNFLGKGIIARVVDYAENLDKMKAEIDRLRLYQELTD